MKKNSIITIALVFIGYTAFAQSKLWSLQQCIDEAINKNISVQNSKANNQINEVNIKQAQQSRIPTLNGYATHNYQFGRTVDPSTYQFIQQNIQTNNIGLNSSVILFNGMQQTNTIKQYKLNYEAGSYDLQKAKNDIMLSVTASYLQIILNKELLANALRQQASTALQVERTEKLVNAGTVPELNLYQLKSQLANDKLSVTRAENQLIMSKVGLMQTMNMEVVNDFDIEVPTIPEPNAEAILAVSSVDIYNTATSTQPQLKSAEYKVNSSAMGVKLAQGAYLPRLTMNTSISTFYSSSNKQAQLAGLNTRAIGFVNQDPTQAVYVTSPEFKYVNYPFFNQLQDKVGEQISFNLSIPIFNGRQTTSNVERNKLNQKIAENNQQNTKNQLRQSIEQAIVDLKSANNNYNSSQEALLYAEKAYTNAEKRFEAGLLNTNDFLIQKNNYTNTQSNLLQAKYDCFFKLKLLEFYQGKAIGW